MSRGAVIESQNTISPTPKSGDFPEFGGKARSLQELSRLGIATPDFVCIPYTVWPLVQLKQGSSWPALVEITHELELANDSLSRRIIGAALRRAVREEPLPFEAENALSAWLGRGMAAPLTFVRSSAATEDAGQTSSAGQYKSVVAASRDGPLRAAIATVLTSFYSDRAIAYRRAHGLDQAGPLMGLILQNAVRPDAAGVLFGCDPITADRSVIVIEASYGLGTTLVSGAATPDLYVVEKKSGLVVETRRGSKKVRDVLSHDGTCVRERVSERLQLGNALTSSRLSELIQVYRAIEQIFASPQDVEWAFEGEQLWILQSRTVTSVTRTEISR